jgi:subtilase family serine protease
MNKAILAVGAVLLVGLAFGLVGQDLNQLAELHVQKIVLDPPSEVIGGDSVQIYTRITNTGGRTADDVAVGFYYRPAGEGQPWILLGVHEEDHLLPSQQDFLEATYDLDTAGLAFGTYQIKVVADVSNRIPEIDELNNELVTSMKLVASTLGLPELQPTDIQFERLTAPDDGKWEVKVNVANLGDDETQSFFKVQFLLNGDPFDPALGESAPNTKVVPPSGQSVQVSGTFNPTARNLGPGTYKVTAVVDSGEQVTEQDEGNNTISAWLTLRPVELHPVSLSFDQPVVRLDEEVLITSRIVNSGEGIARNVEVHFLIGGVRFAMAEIAQLDTEPKDVVVSLNAAQLGLTDVNKVYDIVVMVDPDDELRELDEANNRLTRSVTIQPALPRLAELHPESLILNPASPAEKSPVNDSRGTGTVTVTSVLRNTGRSATGPFHVDFAYRVKGSQRWTAFGCGQGQGCPPIELEAGTDATVARSFDVRSMATGIYEIRVRVDAEQDVEELDENNNELLTTLTLLSSRLADLSADGVVTVAPMNQVKQGQGVDLSIPIVNQGDIDAGTFDVSLSYCKMVWGTTPEETVNCAQDGQFLPVATESVPGGLRIGEHALLEFDLETVDLAPGQYFLRLEIDPDDEVPERNELDNVVNTVVMVQGPDLVAQTVQASWIDVDRDEDGEIDGEAVEVTAQLSNIGVLPAGDFVISFYYVDPASTSAPTATCLDSLAVSCDPSGVFGQIPMEGLDVATPPLVRTVSCIWDPEHLGLEPGSYVLGVLVDAENTVNEHNELNNGQATSFEVPPPPPPVVAADLVALDLSAVELMTDEEDRFHQPVKLTARFRNDGVVPAGDFVVAFYYEKQDADGTVSADCSQGAGADCGRTQFATMELLGLDIGAEITTSCTWDPEKLELGPGAYTLGVIIDADDWVFERDETNNAVETMVELPPYPPPFVGADLAALSLEAEMVPFDEDEDGDADRDVIAVTLDLANIGAVPSGDFEIEFSYREITLPSLGRPVVDCDAGGPCEGQDTSFVAYRTVKLLGLDVDEELTVTCTLDPELFELQQPGFYTLAAVIDINDAVEEEDEENNALETSFLVPPALIGADLVPAAFWARMIPFDADDDGHIDREVIEVTLRIGNQGVIPAGDFEIEFFFASFVPADEPVVDCAENPDADCGASEPVFVVYNTTELLGLDVDREVTVVCTLDPQEYDLERPGIYILGATVDAKDAVLEQNERNNRIEILYKLLAGDDVPDGGGVGTGADLEVMSLFARRSMSDPDDLRAWATIENVGTEDAPPFEVAFYYTPEHDPDPVFSVAEVEGLAVGESVTLLRRFDITGLAPGHYVVGVIADPEDLLKEPNEDNNTRETKLLLF